MGWHIWNETGRAALEGGDVSSGVAILPIAASEQHGPHLPFGVDCLLNAGLLGMARERWIASGEPRPVFELPLLPVGKSDEHFGFPGTLSLRPETMLAMLGDVADSLARHDLKRVIILSSHGGNSEVMALAARRMRVRHGMLALATSWPRMGLPDAPFAGKMNAHQLRYDNHAGAIETALMLHFSPHLVEMDRAPGFTNRAAEIQEHNTVLRGMGGTGFAWASVDLSESGVLGNPSIATAEEGARIAAHQAERFCTLLSEVGAYDISGFEPLGEG